MNRTFLVAAITLAAIVGVARSQSNTQTPPAGDTVPIITQLEQDWGIAIVKKDMAAFDRIVAGEWMFSGPEGEQQTRAQNLADLQSGAYVCTAYKLDDLQVRAFGDTVVALGLETEKSTYQGQDISGQYRFTDVFVKRNGVWQAVATHVSKVVKH